MISSGVRVDDEVLVSDVKPKLRGMGVDASVQVTIMRLLANPPEEPRMTKIAPVMSALFPSVKDAIVEAYAKADDPRKWTESAERALVAWTNRQVADSVRRDIVQGLITDYVLNELGRLDELRRWSVEGGLR